MPLLPNCLLTALFLGAASWCLTTAVAAQAPLHLRSIAPLTTTATEFAADDWNGDGFVDFAVSDTISVSVSLSLGNGIHATAVRYPLAALALSDIRAITSGDLDGDGSPDLVAVRADAHPNFDAVLTVLRNRGDGSFATPVDHVVIGTAVAGSPITPDDLAIADLDGDGRADVIVVASQLNVVQQPGFICIARNITPVHGSITLASSVNVATNRATAESIAIADFDGDADLDVAVCNRLDNDVSVLRNDGTGLGGSMSHETLGGTAAAPIEIAAGDVDNDGLVDLVALNVVGHSYSFVRNLGQGRFRDVGQAPLGSQALPSPSHGTDLTLADLDRDGNLDLLGGMVGDGGNPGYLAILPGLGNGTFGTEQQLLSGPNSNRVIAKDGDGDGDIDVAVASALPSMIRYLVNAPSEPLWQMLGRGLRGAPGFAVLDGKGSGAAGTKTTISLRNGKPLDVGFLLFGSSAINLPFGGGQIVPDAFAPDGGGLALAIDAHGAIDVSLLWPQLPLGVSLYLQYWFFDASNPQGLSASNAMRSRPL
jgi:hypothetical protein